MNKVEAEVVQAYISGAILHVLVDFKEKDSDRKLRSKPYQINADSEDAAAELEGAIKRKCNSYEQMVIAIDDKPHLLKFKKGSKIERDE